MVDLLFDINLQQLPDEYLTGDWRVADRVLNSNDPASALAQATHFQFQPGVLLVQAPTQQDGGHWIIQRDSLLSRPYLQMQLAKEETQALVTRLRRSPDGAQSQLSLYFQSGMEIQLAKP
ncbi:hypothetical protein SAMN00120144_3898 [Hymenobacter roseosalivarius DSM 11622]|uniref:Lipocalin-like domain-containing protein n=1 Tax=Hymenobacter roseosalivarius DSM 11622 TaxID=645990 RepID=A0A1W1W4T3_9BACT|nr:hypothetical protein [Hymenobacter roseosalivarius]SMC00391.1 hypothetical protein SAMN00120144_3898 [Hymenobacter roseosalivarius DSM 11622]